MEAADVCQQASGHVICEPVRASESIRRAMSVLHRRQHVFRVVFSAAPNSVSGKASSSPSQQISESQDLLKSDLRRRQALAMLSAAIPVLTLARSAPGR